MRDECFGNGVGVMTFRFIFNPGTIWTAWMKQFANPYFANCLRPLLTGLRFHLFDQPNWAFDSFVNRENRFPSACRSQRKGEKEEARAYRAF